MREKILHAAHDSPLAMHQGFYKTYRAIRESFTWWGLNDDVLRHVREFDACQRNKGEKTHQARLLQPLTIPERKWESISMDFITVLLAVHGRDCIYVVVDRLKMFAHFFTIPTRYST